MSESVMSIWAVDSFLVTTGLLAAVLLLRRPVAKLFGASVAYALWLIPAARLFMPSLTGSAVTVSAGDQGVRDTVRESILASVSGGEPAAVITTVPSIDFAALAITLWLGGAALFFVIQMIRYASMRDDLLSDAEDVTVIDGVRVVASSQVAGPLAFGLFKRYIAVPQDFARAYSPAERELAIAHEMAHHKSGDLFANLAAFIVLCLMWFNPLAWISWNAFRFDQEAACDARVLAGKCAEDRIIYGQALARTAFDGVPTFATALNSPKTIIERLRRLTMKDASAKRRSIGKLGILTAAAIILPLTATIVPAVGAQDEVAAPAPPVAPAAPEPPAAPKIASKVRIIQINKDGKTVNVIENGQGDGNVQKIVRKGKTITVHGESKFTDDELERLAEEAEKSAADAEKWINHAEKVRVNADEVRYSADVARGHAKAMRVHAVSMAANHANVKTVRLIPSKVGFPMTEAIYSVVHKSQPSALNEKELLRLTLSSLKVARDSVARGRSGAGMPDSEILDALDREIDHLQNKISRN